MTAFGFIGSAYLGTALVAGSYATYLNRGLFIHADKRYLRMTGHTLMIGMLWPLLATATIASLRRSR
jgi:hypothetical protein